MPCYEQPPTEQELRERFYKEFEHNSEVAEMLCGLMRKIEEVEGFETHVSQKTLEWWQAHKIRDRKKEEGGA